MSKQNHIKGSLLKVLAIVLLVIATAPAVSQAQSATARRTWMAAQPSEASVAVRDFGRLILADGHLAFQSSTKHEWRLELSQIKRVSSSKAHANALQIESVTGRVYLVGILDGQLMPASPGKAAQTIERAVRAAPAPVVPARTIMVAGGGSR